VYLDLDSVCGFARRDHPQFVWQVYHSVTALYEASSNLILGVLVVHIRYTLVPLPKVKDLLYGTTSTETVDRRQYQKQSGTTDRVARNIVLEPIQLQKVGSQLSQRS